MNTSPQRRARGAASADAPLSDRFGGFASLERFVPGIALGLFALAYLPPLILDGKTLPFFDQRVLGRAMQIEFIVIIAGGFLIMPVLWPVRPNSSARRGARVMQWLVLLLFYANFGNMAWQAYGPSGAVSFTILVAMTYGAALLGLSGPAHEAPARFAVALCRWILTLIAYVIAFTAFDLPQNSEWWSSDPRVLPAGGLYFAILAVAELTGLFRAIHRWFVGLGFRYTRDGSLAATTSNTTSKRFS